jgi:hypothetical protein
MEYSQIIAANKTRCLSGEAKNIFPAALLLLSKLKHHRTDISLLLVFRSALGVTQNTQRIRKILSSFLAPRSLSSAVICSCESFSLSLISHFHCGGNKHSSKTHSGAERDIVDGTHVAGSQFVKISPLHCVRMHYSEKLSRLTIKLCASMRPALKLA